MNKFKPIVFRGAFSYDTEEASNEACVICNEPSLTIQSMTEDSDINIMMQRFGVGQPLIETARVPQFGDFTHVTDYRSAIESVRAAEDAFMELPPTVRAKFDNDPQRLLEFAMSDAGVAELGKMGLGKEIQYGLREVAGDIASAIGAGIAGGGGKPTADGTKPGNGPSASGGAVGGDGA